MSNPESKLFLPRVETYKTDGRKSIRELYLKYSEMIDCGWKAELITQQTMRIGNRTINFPIWGFTSPIPEMKKIVNSLWILGGVHGEEPAGPNAFAEEINFIKNLPNKDIPVVFIPLLNPKGYFRDWRYPNSRRNIRIGKSVTDSEHLLLKNENKPRITSPNNKTAYEITKWVLNKAKIFLPSIVFNHHEDEIQDKLKAVDPDTGKTYSYIYGIKKAVSAIINEITTLLKENDLPIQEDKTRFGEKIVNGFLINKPDGSIDELFATKRYFDFDTKQIKRKYAAKIAAVIETTNNPDGTIPLSKRIDVHRQIIRQYPHFWDLINQKI
jgi:hypothetical protein